jgi:hypothetical protein
MSETERSEPKIVRNLIVRDWPQSMRRVTAAAYLDMPATEFDRQVAIGMLPASFHLGRHDYWSKAKLDQQIALLAGDFADDWRRDQPAYGGGRS